MYILNFFLALVRLSRQNKSLYVKTKFDWGIKCNLMQIKERNHRNRSNEEKRWICERQHLRRQNLTFFYFYECFRALQLVWSEAIVVWIPPSASSTLRSSSWDVNKSIPVSVPESRTFPAWRSEEWTLEGRTSKRRSETDGCRFFLPSFIFLSLRFGGTWKLGDPGWLIKTFQSPPLQL